MTPRKHTLFQFTKYGVVGLSNVMISYVIFLVALKAGLAYPYALFAGHIIGVLNSYVWNKWWTFQARNTPIRREFSTFFLVYLGTFFLNLSLLYALVNMVEMKIWLAQLTLIIFITLVNFVGHKYWSFEAKKLSKNQWWAASLGVIMLGIFVIMLIPNLVFTRILDGPTIDFTPNVNDRTNAELFYFSYSQEVADGVLMAGDPFSWEHRETTYVRPPFFVWLYGLTQTVLGLDADKTYLLFVTVSTPLLFFVTYLFLRRFPHVSRPLALFGGLFFLLGLEVLWDRTALIPDFIQAWFLGNPSPPVAPIEISRLPSPNHTLFFFVLTLYALVRGLFENHRRFVWVAGLLFGLSFYVYFYLWLLWMIYLPLLGLAFLARRDFISVKTLFKVALIGGVLSIPHWINTFGLQSSDVFYDLGLRTGIIYESHFYSTPLEWAILLLVGIIYPWRDRRFFFLILLIVAMIIGENLQVVLGYNVFPDSWWGKFIRPTVLLLLVLMVPPLLEKLKRLPRTVQWLWGERARWIYGVAGTLVLVLNAVFIQVAFPLTTQAAFRETTERYGTALEWLDQHDQGDQVVLALDEASMLFPVYTSVYPYLPFGLSIQTDAEIEDRFLTSARLLHWTADDVRRYLRDKVHTDYLFAYKYNKSGFTPDAPPIQEKEIESLARRYEADYHDLPIRDAAERYRYTTLFLGPDEREWVSHDFDHDPDYVRLYADESVSVYRFIH